MIPRIAIQLIFEGNYEDQFELVISDDIFGGSFQKYDKGILYKTSYLEEYYLQDLLEKFLVFYERSIKPLDTVASKADSIFLSCCVYASDTIPSIYLSSKLMKSILDLHEGVTLDIDIVLTAESE